MDARGIVDRFVEALDREDFQAAARVIAPGCAYVFRGREVRGREAIVASYADAAAWARESFDEIRYESKIKDEEDGETGGTPVPPGGREKEKTTGGTPVPPGEEGGKRRFRVRFVDLTLHRGVRHRHECEQVVLVGPSGLIEQIEHVDLPGERERLGAFFARVGVKARGD
ncbi:MAG: nuclear transport factor 2 family protein [Phycisphaerales bacterium]